MRDTKRLCSDVLQGFPALECESILCWGEASSGQCSAWGLVWDLASSSCQAPERGGSHQREAAAIRTMLSFIGGHSFHTNACVGLEKVSSIRFTLPVAQIYQDLCEQQNALLSLVGFCVFWASSLVALAGLKSITSQVTGVSPRFCL